MVSTEAISGLVEEFSELVPLVDRIKQIGRTPVDVNDVKDIKDVSLAREVGLLGVYEESDDGSVSRYRIPDLYRVGLGVTRKGQA